jgi:hypothetical protein
VLRSSHGMAWPVAGWAPDRLLLGPRDLVLARRPNSCDPEARGYLRTTNRSPSSESADRRPPYRSTDTLRSRRPREVTEAAIHAGR